MLVCIFSNAKTRQNLLHFVVGKRHSKALTKKKGQVLFELHQKWCPFLQLAAEKKAPFLVQLKKIFGPSYFVRALDN